VGPGGCGQLSHRRVPFTFRAHARAPRMHKKTSLTRGVASVGAGAATAVAG
jgi:hypothetical protein